MTYIVVDVESDGPCPGLYSMVSFGAVALKPGLKDTFYGETRPILSSYDETALSISGITREQHKQYPNPYETMQLFGEWVNKVSTGKPTFISDNPAFDWQFINYYFHKFYGSNPFGFSARRIGDLYCGLVRHLGKNGEWKKKFRKTTHTHNPVDDAMGNAEALLAMQDMGLKFF